MNYELALKLKKAGFPIEDYTDCEVGNCWKNNHPHCYPTLSELILACGNSFGALIHHNYSRGYYSGWRAQDSTNILSTHNVTIYKTPEEAVANLWLALKAK